VSAAPHLPCSLLVAISEPACRGGAQGEMVYNYSLVERWAVRRGLDVHAVDWIIIPVHLGVHWALAVIDLRTRSGEKFDCVREQVCVCVCVCVCVHL
jgi:hypothetical protein